MQVEESMVHFPSPYPAVDSPAAFSPATFSDSGETAMSVDPILTPPTFHSEDGYESHLYVQPSFSMNDLNLDVLEEFLGPADSFNGVPPPPLEQQQSVEEDLHVKRAARSPGAPQVHAHHQRLEQHSNPSRQQLLRVQHSLSMRSNQRTAASGRSSRHAQHLHPRDVVRVSKPVFPTESVPLQEVLRRERPASAAPSILSTRSDPFDTLSTRCSIAAISDPGAYSVRSMHSGDSGVESVCSAPGRLLCPSSQKGFGNSESSTKACMEVEMEMKHVGKIIELDKKILKLQAERSKLVEKAQKSTARVDSPTEFSGHHEKMPSIVRVHLFFIPIGIHVIDEPVFEEASTLLRNIGGMYFDLEQAVATLRNICCKGMARVPDFSTCFAYIKSLLQENQKLQLSSNGEICKIKLDPGVSQTVPQEFNNALAIANRVLQAAQKITRSYREMQMQLQKVQGMARDQTETCDSICQQIGLLDRDRRNQIKAVMEGNFATVSAAVRVWPQYYGAATETIKAITQCIHPS